MPVDRTYPFGKMKWDGGCITNDEEWNNKVGKYYGHIDSKPEETNLKGDDWTKDIDTDKIKNITRFEAMKLGLK